MSAFLFGYGEMENKETEKILYAKKTLKEYNIIFNVDDELNLCYKELHNKILLNMGTKITKNFLEFCFTSINQITNSSNIFTPWGEYEIEEVYPSNDFSCNTKYVNIMDNKLNLLEEALIDCFEILKLKHINLLFTENGYDDIFYLVKKMTIHEMILDFKNMAFETGYKASKYVII